MQLSLYGLLLLTQPLQSSEQHIRTNLEFSSNFGFSIPLSTTLYQKPSEIKLPLSNFNPRKSIMSFISDPRFSFKFSYLTIWSCSGLCRLVWIRIMHNFVIWTKFSYFVHFLFAFCTKPRDQEINCDNYLPQCLVPFQLTIEFMLTWPETHFG